MNLWPILLYVRAVLRCCATHMCVVCSRAIAHIFYILVTWRIFCFWLLLAVFTHFGTHQLTKYEQQQRHTFAINFWLACTNLKSGFLRDSYKYGGNCMKQSTCKIYRFLGIGNDDWWLVIFRCLCCARGTLEMTYGCFTYICVICGNSYVQ